MGGGASTQAAHRKDPLASWAKWRDRYSEVRVGGENTQGEELPTEFPEFLPACTQNMMRKPNFVEGGDFLFLGLNGAGKTSIINILAMRHMSVAPNLVIGPRPGTEPERILCRTKSNYFWARDMPGRRMYRGDWLSEETLVPASPKCIIFVVDAADSFRFPLVKQQFLNLTRIERLDHVSILILANKQDKAGARSAEQLRSELGISKVLRNQKRMLTTFQCSVTDPESVFEAVNWACIACSTAAAAASSLSAAAASSNVGGSAGIYVPAGASATGGSIGGGGLHHRIRV